MNQNAKREDRPHLPFTLLVVSALLLLTSTLRAESPSTDEAAAEGAAGDAGDIVVVVGAGGTSEYAEQFSNWATQWEQVGNLSGMEIRRIGQDATSGELASNATPPPDGEATDGKPSNDREQLQAAIAQLASSPQTVLYGSS